MWKIRHLHKFPHQRQRAVFSSSVFRPAGVHIWVFLLSNPEFSAESCKSATCFVNVSLLIWCFIKCTSGICPSFICFDGDKNKLSKYLTGFKWYSMCALCSVAKGCMFKTHNMLSKRQKGCIPLSSVEFSDRLNVFVILPDNGALIGDFPR